MKTISLSTAFVLASSAIFANELDSTTNSFRSGDRLREQRIVFEDLGRSGEHVLWNLGNVEVVDDSYKLLYSAAVNFFSNNLN